jgi:hypothetical protein
MKNIIKILFLAITVILVSSCLGTRKSTKALNRPMNAELVRLDLKMEDFQLLGEEKLTIDYRKYLGFNSWGLFTFIDSINGSPVIRRNVKSIRFSPDYHFNRLISRAMAPILDKFPEADFVTPVYSTRESNLMFGGSKNKLTVKVKVYKFK